ncbi:hypothetical protein [Anabaena azotica]|nr:hypothetical protein [Anabaena azotica]
MRKSKPGFSLSNPAIFNFSIRQGLALDRAAIACCIQLFQTLLQ